MPFIRRLGLRGLLSFPPDMEPFDLQPLNVLIGPNGSGKTNLIEMLELLRALPTDFAAAIRAGGGALEWVWKGENPAREARIDVETDGEMTPTGRPIRYRLDFMEVDNRIKVLEEAVEDTGSEAEREEPHFSYRLDRGPPNIGMVEVRQGESRGWIPLPIDSGQSILKRLQNDDYPECVALGDQFGRITTFRDWTFGPASALRVPRRTDEPPDALLPDARNLALVLSEIQHRGGVGLDAALKRFLPRYERASTRIVGGSVQLYLHERGLRDPIPATRVSDGTLRFLAMLIALHAPTPPSLLCIEEPELGMHPDAVSLLAELFVEASERMQLVVTTHSDALLSGLGDKVESVLVCENDGHGTTIERLDAQRLAFWLKDYTLGDVWRIGEIGGNP